uniref:General secretion pathway protein M n=1 Tax=Candidatus Kentrum sp. DK TaxID=2126562 RepID=A0A450SAC9_9GAMM|nr:MAG: general secretion pathway protein M [Candidatus Kentron sp. DK]
MSRLNFFAHLSKLPFLQDLGARDRLALAIGGVVVVLSFVWFTVLGPLQDKAESLTGRVAAREADLRWMEQAAREIRRLRGSAADQGAPRSESLLTAVDRSAKEAGIAPAIRHIESVGETGARVRVEGAVFDDLLLWLGNLRAVGVRGTGITIERRKTPGQVNATVVLE